MVANVTGWSDLIAGNMGTAAYSSLDAVFGGWFGLIIFCVVQILILIRTKNYPITVAVGILIYAVFIGVEYTSGNLFFGDTQKNTMSVIMLIEFAGAVYYLWAK